MSSRSKLSGYNEALQWLEDLKSRLLEKNVLHVVFPKKFKPKADESRSKEELEIVVRGEISSSIDPSVYALFKHHLSSKELFDAIHAKYLEPDEFVIQGWMDDMNGLKWKHCKSTSEYVKRKCELFSNVGHVDPDFDDDDKQRSMVLGLDSQFHSSIREFWHLRSYPSLQAVIAAIERRGDPPKEQDVPKEPKAKSKERHGVPVVYAATAKPNGTATPSSKPPVIKCFRCLDLGHYASACQVPPEAIPCHRCGVLGHQAFECEAPVASMLNKLSSKYSVFGKTSRSSNRPITRSAIITVPFLMDNAASFSMTPDSAHLQNVKRTVGETIEAAGGAELKVVGIGEAQLGDLTINDVRIVPEVQQPILSLIQLVDEGHTVTMDQQSCDVIKGDEVVLRGHKEPGPGGMFKVDGSELHEKVTAEGAEVYVAKAVDSADNWHSRLGHIGAGAMKKLEDGMAVGIQIESEPVQTCVPCIVGKGTRDDQSREARRKPEHVGHIVSGDLSGKIAVSSFGAHYTSVLVDHYSGFLGTQCFRTKEAEDVLDHIQAFIALLKNQTSQPVKIFRSDGGREYVNTEAGEFFRSQGIVQEITAPFTPAGNGRTERMNRSIFDMVRTMLQARKIPNRYWAYAVRTACFLINRTSESPFVKGKTPYEVVFGVKPDLSELYEFGSSCFIFDEALSKRKLLARHRPGKFLGYAEGQQGYFVLEADGSVSISKNVRFVDDDEATPWPHVDDEETQLSEGSTDDDDESSDDEESTVVVRTAPRRAARHQGPFVFSAIKKTSDSPRLNQALIGNEKDKWTAAIDKEVKALEEMGAISPVDPPKSGTIVGSTVVLKKKRGPDGEVLSYKARWTGQGFTQRPGIDYEETYAPTVHFETLLTLLAVATSKGMHVHQMDVDNAYLNADLKEVIYLRPPKELQHKWPGKVMRVFKALYGLKQSANAWYELLSSSLVDLGWVKSSADACLFTRTVNGKLQYLAIYVDDLVIAAVEESAIAQAKLEIMGKFKCKDLGAINYLLGIKVDYDVPCRVMKLSQQAYIRLMCDRFGVDAHKKSRIPMAVNDYPTDFTGEASDETKQTYQELIGSLQYIAHRTRPDVAVSVGILSRFVANPSEAHLDQAKRVLAYLQETIEHEFILSGDEQMHLVCYADSDWAGDTNDRKSRSGFAIKLGKSLVNWGSLKQNCVALSTAEAEYIALTECCKELLWMKCLMSDFGVEQSAINVYSDNQAAIHMVHGAGSKSKSKHIDKDYHFIKDLVKKNIIEVSYIPSKENPADAFTKPLAKDSIHTARSRLCVVLPVSDDRRSVVSIFRKGHNLPFLVNCLSHLKAVVSSLGGA